MKAMILDDTHIALQEKVNEIKKSGIPMPNGNEVTMYFKNGDSARAKFSWADKEHRLSRLKELHDLYAIYQPTGVLAVTDCKGDFLMIVVSKPGHSATCILSYQQKNKEQLVWGEPNYGELLESALLPDWSILHSVAQDTATTN